MKFEVKTQNDDLTKPSLYFFLVFSLVSFIVIFSSISLKLGTISKHYKINYLCNILTIEKSSINYRKLSKLTNQRSKQKMWDLCREIRK